ncbi:MAG: phenylacetate--CoA ligase family protein [Deferribacterales bacterium]
MLYKYAEMREGRSILDKLFQMYALGGLSYDERQTLNRELIYRTLSSASVNVPYYRDLFKKIGFVPEKVRSDIGFLTDIPLLTKDIILEHGSRMISDLCHDKKQFHCKTGGSTGKTVVVIYDQDAADWSAAATLYGRSLAGKSIFDSELHFSAKFDDIPGFKDRLRESVKIFSMNRFNYFFATYSKEEMTAMWRYIESKRPKLVHSHPSTMYALALAVRDGGFDVPAFEIFESSGELLNTSKRRAIEQYLQCRVVDRYGLAELGVVAYEDGYKDEWLRVFDGFAWVESVNNELVMTSMRNDCMPMIRYNSGDSGLIAEENGYRYITDIGGRIHDTVMMRGRKTPTHYIQDIIDHRVGECEEFQIIEKKDGRYTLCIVPKPDADINGITDRLKKYFADDLEIKFISTCELTLVGRRNKFRYLVRETDDTNQI